MKRLLLISILLAISFGFAAAQKKPGSDKKVDGCVEGVLRRLPTDVLQGVLLIAIYENDNDCVKTIFGKFRLNPNFKLTDDNGKTVVSIIWVIDHGSLESINEFLKAGLDVKSEEVKLALFSAIKSIQIGKLEALLKGGADVHLKDKDGQTALSLAEKIEDSEKEIESGKTADQRLWSGTQIKRWVKDKTGKEVHKTTAWRMFGKLKFTSQVPRPFHRERASEEEQTEFKKS